MGQVQSFIPKTPRGVDPSTDNSVRGGSTAQAREAILNGNAHRLAELLRTSTVNLDELDTETGASVFHLAASLDNHEVLQALMSSRECYGYQLAIRDGQGYTPLMRAVERSDEKAMELLTTSSYGGREFRANEYHDHSIPEFAHQHDKNAVLYCKAGGNTSLALHHAIQSGNSESARFFASMGADPLYPIRKTTIDRQDFEGYRGVLTDTYGMMDDDIGWSVDNGFIQASDLMQAIKESSAVGEKRITNVLAKQLARAAPEQQINNAVYFASKNEASAVSGLFSADRRDYSEELLAILYSKDIANSAKILLARFMSANSTVDGSNMLASFFREKNHEILGLLIKADLPYSFLSTIAQQNGNHDSFVLLAKSGINLEYLFQYDYFKPQLGDYLNEPNALGVKIADAAIDHLLYRDEDISNDKKTEKLQDWFTNVPLAKQGVAKYMASEALKDSHVGILDRLKPMIDAGTPTTELLAALGERGLKTTALELVKKEANFDSATQNIGRAMEMLINKGQPEGAAQLALVLESLISSRRDAGLASK